MKTYHHFFILCILFTFSISLIGQDFVIPYDLDHPSKIQQLPKELNEASGLSYLKPGHLLCNHDEAGKAYTISIETGEILEQITLEKKGDFEGIEQVDNDIWMVTSKGDLYQYKSNSKKKDKTKTYKTHLSTSNNIESLGYDPIAKNLLIGCKNRPGEDKKDYKGKRAIYVFNLKKKELSSKPHYLIDLKELKECYHFSKAEKLSLNILNFLKGKDEDMVFKPTGIAIHPFSHYTYVLSGKLGGLAVLDRNGKLLSAKLLNPRYFRQPEGICFDLSGNLYICNEGSNNGGSLLTFKYLK